MRNSMPVNQLQRIASGYLTVDSDGIHLTLKPTTLVGYCHFIRFITIYWNITHNRKQLI